MIYFLYLFCFLIISCDLPSEANKDCNGDKGGIAFIDDCGICSGNETGHLANSDKDLCDVCFGENSCYEPQCNDETAINYFDNASNINNSLCIYDICTDYFENNEEFQCNALGSDPYQLGDQLSCETLQTEFDICYPADCGSVRLSDFEDKNILIIYEFDW
tara:strand:- start:676 stop:1158 length:483 start_codon:yes stop_codon:yes gene_type:complete